MLDDYRTAPIGAAEKALFAFIDKMNRESTAIGPADVDAAKAAGWTDEALYDAITVCALFNFYNLWIDASGVHALSEEAHKQGGVRSANMGYVRK